MWNAGDANAPVAIMKSASRVRLHTRPVVIATINVLLHEI
jgi:hypothetical protein